MNFQILTGFFGGNLQVTLFAREGVMLREIRKNIQYVFDSLKFRILDIPYRRQGYRSLKLLEEADDMVSLPADAIPDDVEIAFVVSCDRVYYEHFCSNYIMSLARNVRNRRIAVVIGLVNPPDYGEITRRKIGAVDVVEVPVRLEIPSNLKKRYKFSLHCASARFILARKIIRDTHCHVFLSDIDVLFRENVERYIDLFLEDDTADVGFYYNQYTRKEGSQILAGALWLNNTGSTLRFLDDVTRRLLYFMKNHRLLPRKIDQRCICRTYRELRSFIRPFALPHSFFSTTYGNSATFAVLGKVEQKRRSIETLQRQPREEKKYAS